MAKYRVGDLVRLARRPEMAGYIVVKLHEDSTGKQGDSYDLVELVLNDRGSIVCDSQNLHRKIFEDSLIEGIKELPDSSYNAIVEELGIAKTVLGESVPVEDQNINSLYQLLEIVVFLGPPHRLAKITSIRYDEDNETTLYDAEFLNSVEGIWNTTSDSFMSLVSTSTEELIDKALTLMTLNEQNLTKHPEYDEVYRAKVQSLFEAYRKREEDAVTPCPYGCTMKTEMDLCAHGHMTVDPLEEQMIAEEKIALAAMEDEPKGVDLAVDPTPEIPIEVNPASFDSVGEAMKAIDRIEGQMNQSTNIGTSLEDLEAIEDFLGSNYPNPTPQDFARKDFATIWSAIRSWDICRSTERGLYSSANGNDVMHILKWIDDAGLIVKPKKFVPDFHDGLPALRHRISQLEKLYNEQGKELATAMGDNEILKKKIAERDEQIRQLRERTMT